MSGVNTKLRTMPTPEFASPNTHRLESKPANKILLILPCLALALSACVSPPRHERVVSTPPPTDVYVYPSQGQSESQLDRDRYECNDWAVRQSHYDPSDVHNETRVRVVTEPSGANTAVGAVTGAVVGSLLAGPRDAFGGAVVGGVAGAMLGAASDNAQQQQARREQRQYDARYAHGAAYAQAYRRAISACLEGRGYTVK